jgi:hypothetical protein
MIRLLLADVTLIRGTGITVHVRFNGGASKTLELPRPLTAWKSEQHPRRLSPRSIGSPIVIPTKRSSTF